MLKVLNIAQFIPVEGLQPDNDISLKIYYNLKKAHAIQSEFVKPVPYVPRWQALLKKSLKHRREIFTRTDYYNAKYNIRIHFYNGTSPIIDMVPFDTSFLVPIQFRFYYKNLIELTKIYKPDLIHAHSIYPDAYYALQLFRKTGIPYIVTIRGPKSNIYFSGTGREILHNASSVTTPSHALWSDLKDRYSIELLPHGIDEIWYNGIDKELHTDGLRLVTVSRLLELKNIQVVLRAIAILVKEGYKVSYDIIGDGNYRENLLKLTNELNIQDFVRFHGFRDPDYMKNIYHDADIFVMLSKPETFGRSFFEAAAQGLYIIGARNTGAYGHLSESEATFIDIDESKLIEALKKIDSKEFYSKTLNLALKIKDFRNATIIEKYHNIISGIV